MSITLNGTTGITTPDLTSAAPMDVGGSAVLTSASSLSSANLADDSITSAKLTGDAVPIGVGQTWQNLTASRAVNGTTYYNTTGKPIQLFVGVSVISAQSSAMTIDGVNVGQTYNGNGTSIQAVMSAVIPNNSSYSVSGGSIVKWSELR